MPTSLLFAIWTLPLATTLVLVAKIGNIIGLKVHEDQILIKMFVDDSQLFLKAKNKVLRNALWIVQDFAVASRSFKIISKD